jgi:hypothetical protein
MRPRAPRLERGEEVLDHLLGLGDRIALTHQIAFGVERNGSRREDHGPAAAHGNVRVAGRRGERIDVVELDRHV